jgi:hypothetical protein
VRLARALGLSVALSMCAFLLGLSYAPDAVPGDNFQFVRSAPSHAAQIVDLTPLTKAGSPDGKPSPHQLSPILHQTATLDSPLVAGAVVVAGAAVHSGRCAGTAGCRGPPTS